MYGKMNFFFYPKKSETNTDGMVMLYARITINGKRGEFSLVHRVDEQRWDSRGAELRGSSRRKFLGSMTAAAATSCLPSDT